MSQLAIQQEQQKQIPNASESIAACKALFNGSATRGKFKNCGTLCHHVFAVWF